MNRSYHAIRRPVRRPRADTYLLITLLSFALSISLTRLFLELTGYPQIGGGTLHISHVLWGGLLLFIAAMLPLILANRWVYWVTALLAGIGIGLFIDEVGKFITQSYDYFYPPAAPIVYAFFLICVLIYLQINRPQPRQARAEMYAALETFEDLLDRDLDPRERAEIERRLKFVIEQGDDPDLARFANQLMDYFKFDRIYLAPIPPYRLERFAERLSELEARYLVQRRLRTVLVVGLGLLGLASTIFPAISILDQLFSVGLHGFVNQYWFISLLLVQMVTGTGLIYAAVLLATNREQPGIRIAYITLLIYLTMVNLFLFYYYQFSTILAAGVQFILLLGVIHYRRRYLDSEEFG
jgi:hypothetical protein